jgi:hypothetical protein
MAILAALVTFALAAPSAQAASPHASPDPSPQAAPSPSGGGPGPDPAPQAAPAPVTSAPVTSASSSASSAPVVPRPTSSGIGVASPVTGGGSTTTAATAPIQPSPSVHKSLRHAVHHAQRPPAWVAVVTRQLTTPWRKDPLLATTAAGAQSNGSPQPSTPPRNGLLLLLGSAALAVLALASGSMLRLLRRMDGVRL